MKTMATKEEVATKVAKDLNISLADAKDIVNEIAWEIADVLDLGLGQKAVEEILYEFGLDSSALTAFM